MATQAEINQLLGTWVANLLKIVNASDSSGRADYLSGTGTLTKWANTYIKPIVALTGTATISLPTVSKTIIVPGKFRGKQLGLSYAYAKALLASINTLRSELPGILNTLQIKNAGTILAEFDKIRISISKEANKSR
jgi:hypothetical protein